MEHYKIVRAKSIDSLCEKVNSNIEAGFVCVGGVSSRIKAEAFGIVEYEHIQAMIYKEENK